MTRPRQTVDPGRNLPSRTAANVDGHPSAAARCRNSPDWFQALFEASPDPVWIIENGQFIDCNAAAIAALGYSEKAPVLFVHPRKLSPKRQPCGESSLVKATRMIRMAEERGMHRFEWVHRRANGSEFPTEVTLSAISLQGRDVIYCSWRDLSEHRQIERALRESEQRFRDFAFASADWIWEVDNAGRYTYVAGNVESVLGYTPAELIGRTPFDIMPPEEAQRLRPMMMNVVRRGDPFSNLRNINLHKDGTLKYTAASAVPIRDGSGRVMGYRGIDRDITELQERDARILKLAYHDSLTELPNRVLLEDRVTQALAAARRNRSRTALMFLDLDRFKVVNDSLGHDVGDALLTIMARRMRSVLRASDTLARLGGDEFVIVPGDCGDGGHLVSLAEKIIAEVSRPVSLQGHEFTIGVSIGAAIAPDDGDDFHTLLKQADIAMYRAKEDGKSTMRFFDRSMNARVMGHLHLEGRLRKAIDNGDLELHYQPKVRLPGHELCGVEALVRWRLDGEMVPPATFIPIAEESGLIGVLGDQVLAMALDQICAWNAAGLPTPRVAVNFSARQFADDDLVNRVLRSVSERGLSPHHLEIELTESVMMSDLDRASTTLGQLHREGFVLTLDDFGTGYSSLGYLKRLPLHCVKIDRSFVRDISSDTRDAALVEAILAIGRALGLEVVAEGVETAGQLAFLVDHHCTLFQGYLFSRPLPAANMHGLLRRGLPGFPAGG